MPMLCVRPLPPGWTAAVKEVQQSSRHYAKRQLTWFRRNKAIHWLRRSASVGTEEILAAARQVLHETDK